MYNPTYINRIEKLNSIKIALYCIAGALVFTIFPLFGWSHYSLESSLVQCSVEWAEKSFNVISYNMVMFFFAFLVPLSLIIYCNLRLILMVIKEFIYFLTNILICSPKVKSMPNVHRASNNRANSNTDLSVTLNLIIFTSEI